jgi:Protein of unknown function (DUF3606)
MATSFHLTHLGHSDALTEPTEGENACCPGQDLDMKIKDTQPSLDRANIDIRNKWEVRHWTKEWDVTKIELQRAIDKVGPAVHAIAKELRGNGHKMSKTAL